ncbi:hypothetical protein U0X36_10855 [Bacillus thuringiensis]|uniref:hypothetical protein n=1 Tax=Bacillus thuringiensis TaxID=1428 RepID=UPI000E53DB13|nr:hypothetical protein [Bacillus thuringiensis]MDZ3953396.1 hypothetical protein [Bacillus thuringiensis]RGP42649.1 hypothetical protein BTW32_30810 [Bacillus thuringiensis]
MRKPVDVHGILHKLLTEYEQTQGKLHFSFQCIKDEFVFKEIGSLLQEIYHYKKETPKSFTLQVFCRNNYVYQKLHLLYELV